jgi:hypothetical protein
MCGSVMQSSNVRASLRSTALALLFSIVMPPTVSGALPCWPWSSIGRPVASSIIFRPNWMISISSFWRDGISKNVHRLATSSMSHPRPRTRPCAA